MSGHIELGGRAFALVNYAAITSLNEHYVMKLMRQTGLDRVLPKADGETDDQYLLRLEAALVDTLRLHELIAGYILPMGKTESDWDLQMARDTARHLQGLQSQADRAEVHRLGMSIVFDFFRHGLDSFKTLEKSLSELASPPIQPESVSTIAAS